MERGRTGRWWLRLAAAGVLLTGAAGFVACGDDDDDAAGDTTPAASQAATPAVSAEEKAVQQVFLDAIDRWNANDLDGFLVFFTDEGLVSSFGDEGQTVAELKVGLADFIGSPTLKSEEFLDTGISGETATMDALFAFGATLTRSKFGLVKVGADWKLNSEESNLPVEVPAGTELIEVDLNEFAFGIDTSAITDATGPFALEAKNVGKQPHMLALARIPADANVEELLQEEDSEAVEFIGGGDDIAPGASSSMVFVGPLDAGRYVMVCFLPDTDEGEEGTPHFMKGMLKEFTVK